MSVGVCWRECGEMMDVDFFLPLAILVGVGRGCRFYVETYLNFVLAHFVILNGSRYHCSSTRVLGQTQRSPVDIGAFRFRRRKSRLTRIFTNLSAKLNRYLDSHPLALVDHIASYMHLYFPSNLGAVANLFLA